MDYEESQARREGSKVDLEEVIGGTASNVRLGSSRSRVELQEGMLHVLIELHDGRLVAAAVAVVGRREDRDDRLFVAPVVAFHDELMRARDESEAVGAVELLRHVLTERVTGSTGGDTPSTAIIGIGPEQVAHGSLVGNLLETIQSTNAIEGVDEGRQSSVQAEDAILDQSGQGQKVEQIREHLPNVDSSILTQALVVESVATGSPSRAHPRERRQNEKGQGVGREDACF